MDALGKRPRQLYSSDVPTERLSEAAAHFCAYGLLSCKEEGKEPSIADIPPVRMGRPYVGLRVQLLDSGTLRPLTTLCAVAFFHVDDMRTPNASGCPNYVLRGLFQRSRDGGR